MNKQNLKQLLLATDCVDTTKNADYKIGFKDGMKIAANLLDQSHEPYKPEVSNGYDVEKEPLHYVPLPDGDKDSQVVYALEKKRNGSIEISLVHREILGVSDSTKLSEQEIKSVDERYLLFAIRIKEVTED